MRIYSYLKASLWMGAAWVLSYLSVVVVCIDEGIESRLNGPLLLMMTIVGFAITYVTIGIVLYMLGATLHHRRQATDPA